MDAVAFLHLCFEDLALGELVLLVDGVVEVEAEGLFLAVEFVIPVASSFIQDQVDLVASDVGLVLISQLVFVLNSDQHYQKPLIND